jgi:hypothetical protein
MHACRIMHANLCRLMHACQLLLMRACVRRAYCKKMPDQFRVKKLCLVKCTCLKAYFLVYLRPAVHAYRQYYSIRTRVQTVSLNPYSCTCGMTPFVHVYTPDGSTRTAVQPASLHRPAAYIFSSMCSSIMGGFMPSGQGVVENY